MKITVRHGYKYPVYPTEEQKNFIEYTIDCLIFFWNLVLNLEKIIYMETGKHELLAVTGYKSEFPFLYDIDSSAICRTMIFIKNAFKSFFKGDSKLPRLKDPKKTKRSYSTNQTNDNIRIEGNSIRLPKVGLVKADIYRPLPKGCIIKQATVSRDRTGQYWISLSVEYETYISVDVRKDILHIGLDYKSDGLYIDSNGYCPEMPRFYEEEQNKLAKLQRKLSKRVPGSKNYEKIRKKIAKLQRHIMYRRDDFLQKLSTEITNKYDVISVETLNLKGISSHKSKYKLGKYTLDNGYYKFLTMLEYKLKERGKCLIRLDKTFPSSQLCFNCGYKNTETKDLSKREIVCPVCGSVYDRDINAAKNIDREGFSKIKTV